MEIIYDLPVILTKDKEFFERFKDHDKWCGRVMLLPEDAVLYVPPVLIGVETPI